LPQPVEIPEPGLALVLKMKDDALFNRLDQLLESNPQVSRVDEDGLRMRTMPVPIPVPIPFRPTLARAGDHLFVASTDTLVREILAVRDGSRPGLKSTDEFKRMARGIPEEGNSFVLVSPRFSKAISEAQSKVLASVMAEEGGSPLFFQSLLAHNATAFSYDVSANTEQGWVSVGNGNADPGKTAATVVLMQPAAVVGLLSAIAIPNFVKARSTAQRNTVINNLRIIEGAKDQWAIENRKSDGAGVTERDLETYIRGGRVRPIVGETYSINPVGQPATAKAPVRLGEYPAGAAITAE